MHARSVTVPVDPGEIENMMEVWLDSVLPAAKSQSGFKGNLLLADRSSGEVMSVTMWDSEAAMLAGEASGYYQEQLAKLVSMFKGQPDMKHYEVLLLV